MISGIDVSHYQEEIDWSAVAESGVKFAYIKCTEGQSFVDPWFAINWQNAQANGLICGAYHFLTDAPVDLQVKLFRKMAPAFGLPPVIDAELSVLRAEEVTDFVKLMEVRCMLYTDTIQISLHAYPPGLTPLLWIADYNRHAPRIKPWTNYTFWQWTDQGAVPGITGPVDLDWFNGTEEDLKALLLSP